MATATATNAEIWNEMSSRFYAKRVEEAMALWHEDARWEAVFPAEGMPRAVEGRTALTQMFGGLAAVAERIEVHDVRFHQTDDPAVAFVEERMVIDLNGGGRYENRIVMRLTFRDGLIAEMLEYSDARANEALMRAAAG